MWGMAVSWRVELSSTFRCPTASGCGMPPRAELASVEACDLSIDKCMLLNVARSRQCQIWRESDSGRANVRFGFVCPVSLALAPTTSRCPPRKQSPAVAREVTASMAWSKTARRLLSRLLHQARVVPCSCKPIRLLITVLCECIAPRLFLSRRTGRLGHRMRPSNLQTDHPCPLPTSACNCAIACKRASEPKTSSWPRMRRGRAAASGQSRPWA